MKVHLYTDGSCLSNPNGPGGWAYSYRHKNEFTQGCGNVKEATNNQMELRAAINGLKDINENFPKDTKVIVHSDSQYLVNGMKKWLKSWKRRQWKTAGGDRVANIAYWLDLEDVCEDRNITWVWVKAHSGDSENELVDKLARKTAEKLNV